MIGYNQERRDSMVIACIGNTAYDNTVSSDKFIKEGVRNDFQEALFSVGGPTSNAASVLAKFGNQVEFYGQVGNDSNGHFIRQEMARENIDLTHLNVSNNVMTPSSFVIINRTDNTRTICSTRSKSDFVNPKIEEIEFGDYYDYILTDGKYPEDTIELIKHNPKAIKIMDAGRINEGNLRLAQYMDYIICSEDFANGVVGEKIDYRDIEKTSRIFWKLKGMFPNVQELAITIGEHGYICSRDGEVIIMPAYQHGKVTIDTNGAGDIFHGAFTHALANGYDYYDSLEFANVTASLSTTKAGGRKSCPNLEEVEHIIKKGGKRLVRAIER